MRIAIGIATAGRPQLLPVVLAEFARQSRPPERIIISAPSRDDIGDLDGAWTTKVEIIVGSRGLTRQRNTILDRADDIDIVVFFDDDFLPEPEYLEIVDRVFTADRDIVIATGTLIADGILGPGFSVKEARARLESATAVSGDRCAMLDVDGVYGCNMAVRMEAANSPRRRFDPKLPLYGWLEDVDFSGQFVHAGRIVQLAAARGVHLGIKQGRQSGVRLGYSQVANPIYLSRKGTCPWSRSLRLISRNLAANCFRSFRPEPYVDRLGRVAGNLRAFRDLLTGRLAPDRILDL